VLMFVNISPANYNIGETLCSLNFATRCRNTELGMARKVMGTEKEKEKGTHNAVMDTERASPKSGGGTPQLGDIAKQERRSFSTSSHR
jgi:hypothetical protein